MKTQFEKELRELVNRHYMEAGSNTPDHILAKYLCACFDAFDNAVNQREKWYGREEKRPLIKERK